MTAWGEIEILEMIPLFGAFCTLALGVSGLIAPLKVASYVGIIPEGMRGLSEVRATYGGIFIGLGVACFLLQQPEVYVAVGLAWLLAAVSRTISIFLDRAFSGKNVAGIIIETSIGLLLVVGML